MNTILHLSYHLNPLFYDINIVSCLFVETLDKILFCFLKKACSRQSYCASHVARTFIGAFHLPCFTAP